jgi:hypothetical protein
MLNSAQIALVDAQGLHFSGDSYYELNNILGRHCVHPEAAIIELRLFSGLQGAIRWDSRSTSSAAGVRSRLEQLVLPCFTS